MLLIFLHILAIFYPPHTVAGEKHWIEKLKVYRDEVKEEVKFTADGLELFDYKYDSAGNRIEPVGECYEPKKNPPVVVKSVTPLESNPPNLTVLASGESAPARTLILNETQFENAPHKLIESGIPTTGLGWPDNGTSVTPILEFTTASLIDPRSNSTISVATTETTTATFSEENATIPLSAANSLPNFPPFVTAVSSNPFNSTITTGDNFKITTRKGEIGKQSGILRDQLAQITETPLNPTQGEITEVVIVEITPTPQLTTNEKTLETEASTQSASITTTTVGVSETTTGQGIEPTATLIKSVATLLTTENEATALPTTLSTLISITTPSQLPTTIAALSTTAPPSQLSTTTPTQLASTPTTISSLSSLSSSSSSSTPPPILTTTSDTEITKSIPTQTETAGETPEWFEPTRETKQANFIVTIPSISTVSTKDTSAFESNDLTTKEPLSKETVPNVLPSVSSSDNGFQSTSGPKGSDSKVVPSGYSNNGGVSGWVAPNNGDIPNFSNGGGYGGSQSGNAGSASQYESFKSSPYWKWWYFGSARYG